MRINETMGPVIRSISRPKRRQDRFSVPSGEEQEPAQDAAGISSPSLVLGMDMIETPSQVTAAEMDRQAAAHGEAMLDALNGLQLAALGQGGTEAWDRLGALAERASSAGTPGLQGVLDAISARAAVELERRRG